MHSDIKFTDVFFNCIRPAAKKHTQRITLLACANNTNVN